MYIVRSKSIMQLTWTIFSYLAIFIKKKTVENWLWAKSEFLSAKRFYSFGLNGMSSVLMRYIHNFFGSPSLVFDPACRALRHAYPPGLAAQPIMLPMLGRLCRCTATISSFSRSIRCMF